MKPVDSLPNGQHKGVRTEVFKVKLSTTIPCHGYYKLCKMPLNRVNELVYNVVSVQFIAINM